MSDTEQEEAWRAGVPHTDIERYRADLAHVTAELGGMHRLNSTLIRDHLADMAAYREQYGAEITALRAELAKAEVYRVQAEARVKAAQEVMAQNAGEMSPALEHAILEALSDYVKVLAVTATLTECGCGHANEHWHPKRGKCKYALGGVKL